LDRRRLHQADADRRRPGGGDLVRARRAGHLAVAGTPFGGLASEVAARLEAELADLGRFLRVETRLEIRGMA
jgi:hypothetical protein